MTKAKIYFEIFKTISILLNIRIMYVKKKDRPGTDQTLKLVSYNSYTEFMTKQESMTF